VLDPHTVNDTLGVLLKYQDDISKVQGSEAAAILNRVKAESTKSGNEGPQEKAGTKAPQKKILTSDEH
jgi:hypothetical protein